MKSILLAVLFIFSGIGHADILNRNTSEYNLGDNLLGLKGYDPMSYFKGQPTEGSADITYELSGVIYQFVSEENKAEFIEKSSVSEPTYGGWCAYAMARGTKVDINPTLYTITPEGRLHMFRSNRTKKKFDRDVVGHEVNADQNWESISGEVFVQP